MTPTPLPRRCDARRMTAIAGGALAALLCAGSAFAEQPAPPRLVLPATSPKAAPAVAAPAQAGNAAPRRAANPPARAVVAVASAASAAAAAAASAAAAAAAADSEAGVDPLERLRQRLAERLSSGVTAGSGGPYDVRISTRSALARPTPAAATTAAAKGVAVRPARAGSKDGKAARVADGPGAGALHWGYQGETGPSAWAGMKPEYALCKTGERQSPIDIRGGLAVELDPVRFDYQPSPFAVLDTGHAVQVKPAPGNSIEVGGRRYELQQFHFHHPSEERIDGRQFEISLHLVHKDEQGRMAVVALLFDAGPPHPVVQEVLNNLPLERGEAMPAREALELAALLPNDRRYYTYMGSLTTPPCSEGVQWIVMRAPQGLTAEQIGIFSRLYPMNARPLQAAAGRRILQSD